MQSIIECIKNNWPSNLFYYSPLVNVEDKALCFSERNFDQNSFRLLEEFLAISFFQNIQRTHRYIVGLPATNRLSKLKEIVNSFEKKVIGTKLFKNFDRIFVKESKNFWKESIRNFNIKQMATCNDFYQNSSWKSKWLHLLKDKRWMHTVHKRS